MSEQIVGLIGATGRQGQRYLMARNGGEAIRHVHLRSLSGGSKFAGSKLSCAGYELDTWGDVAQMLHSCTHIIIATPTPTHYELTKRCLLAGKNVLVEKPLAETYEQCLELIELAEARGVKLMVAHTHVHGERWRACAAFARDMGWNLEVITSGGPAVALDWAPHAAAMAQHMGQAMRHRHFRGANGIEAKWEGNPCFLRWTNHEPAQEVTPMRYQLQRFLGNWTEDLRAIYGMVFGVGR